MLSTSTFSCIMTMISDFTMFFISKYLFSSFSLQCEIFLYLHTIPAALLLIISFFSKINYVHCVFSSVPLHTSCLFYKLLSEDIIDLEKPDGILLLLQKNFQDYF